MHSITKQMQSLKGRETEDFNGKDLVGGEMH
jgi:hypothetical protein